MDIPESIAAIAKAIDAGEPPRPEPEFFTDRGVFAAEFNKIFLRPWLAVDHCSRVPVGNGYFLFDAAIRRMILSRDADGRLHALRNTCLHAGYPVCESDEPEATELFCPYHGWQYRLDGRLAEPRLHAEQDSLPRYRLQSYPLHLTAGLVLVDPSGEALDAPPELDLPGWLPEGQVTMRRRFGASVNWKHLRHHFWGSPEIFLPDGAKATDLGPLSRILANSRETILLRLIPLSSERTDCEVVRILESAGEHETDMRMAERIAESLAVAKRLVERDPVGFLSGDFFLWYARLMA